MRESLGCTKPKGVMKVKVSPCAGRGRMGLPRPSRGGGLRTPGASRPHCEVRRT